MGRLGLTAVQRGLRAGEVASDWWVVRGHRSLVGRGSRRTRRFNEASDIDPAIGAVGSLSAPNRDLPLGHGSARFSA